MMLTDAQVIEIREKLEESFDLQGLGGEEINKIAEIVMSVVLQADPDDHGLMFVEEGFPIEIVAHFEDLAAFINSFGGPEDHPHQGFYQSQHREEYEEERKDVYDESGNRIGSRGWEDDTTGGRVEVTRYSNGRSTYHHGGPCGEAHYDENGEEC